MNILIIENSTAFTGAFKCALNEAELLSANHRFVFVIHKNSTVKDILVEKKISFYTLPLLEIRKSVSVIIRYPFVLLLNTFRLRHIIRKEDIDIVQANDFYNLLGASLKFFGYRGKTITYVRFIPSVMPGTLRKLWIAASQRFSHRTIAVSDTVLNELPYHPNTIRIYDPLNLHEKLPIPVHTQKPITTLLYLSNYIRGKGQDYALEAFINAYKQNSSLRLKFIGGDMGLEKNRLFRQVLEDKVKELNLNDVVSFASFSSNIEQEIKSADILLNFSNAESLSMTCLEAAFFGTAVIATRCGGPEEIIKHEETGLLVPVADIKAMTEAILTLAGNVQLRQTYSTAGRQYVQEKFSKQEFITAFQNMLNA